MSGYIGTAPVPQATQTRDSITATNLQTVFPTGGYTPQFLDVYLNGIFLNNGADYTAANGSDVILTTGAATGDILEVVAYTAFDTANVTGATNFTVTGAFTSQGIDDNGNATAITIDSSENVMVGTTDDAPANNSAGSTADDGFAIKSDGNFQVAKYNGTPAYINRTGNDGTLIDLRKDGTTVGSISTKSDDLVIHSSTTNHVGLSFGDGNVLPTNNYGTTSNNTVDLGSTSRRFKDLYLSGGVDFGGAVNSGGVVSSSNKLDDYEEGTWTPSIAGNATYSARTGQYVKVGRMVTAAFDMTINAINSSAAGSNIQGLPFTAGGSTQGQAGSVSYWSGAASSLTYIAVRVDLTATSLGLSFTTSAVSTAQLSLSFWKNSARMIGTITYVEQ